MAIRTQRRPEPAPAKREDGLLLGILIAALLIAFAGRAFSGALTPATLTVAPIKTELSGQIVIEGETVRININTADAELLESLPGIGPALSLHIAEYREANGPFQSVDDLIQVKGIGEAVLEKLRGRACVE